MRHGGDDREGWLTMVRFFKYVALVFALLASQAQSAGLISASQQAHPFGVNLSGAEFAPWTGQTFPSTANWNDLQAKGIGIVRLPIAWESLQPTLGSALNSTYLGSITTALSAAASRGIKVIVDLHNFGSYCDQAHWVSSGCGYAGNAGTAGTGVSFLGSAGLTQANFVDVWTRLATALAGNPGLAGYDLMNEPSIGIAGTNLLFAPNGFADSIGSQPWIITNGAVLAQEAAGTNSVAGYGPAWSMSSGSGFGGIFQSITLAAVPYSLSFSARQKNGTTTVSASIGGSTSGSKTLTASWQIFCLANVTPSAGSTSISFGLDTATIGVTVEIDNFQLEQSATCSTYQPNPLIPFYQAAINGIRTVDTVSTIYVEGMAESQAYQFPWVNWELATLTGGPFAFEAHQYFDGSLSQGGGGGVYSGTFTSYGIDVTAGAQMVAPFVNWTITTGVKGYLGEFAVTSACCVVSPTDNNAAWLPLENNFLAYLWQNRIPATMWFYGSNGIQSGNNLNMAPVAGVDDQRLVQMLAIP
jgi:hypothetical protein